MSIPAWARVGAKVAYIGVPPETTNLGAYWLPSPEINQVCTVTEVRDERGIYGEKWGMRAVYVRVAEAVGVRCLLSYRPLISQADDISTHFQALLSTPVKKEEDA